MNLSCESMVTPSPLSLPLSPPQSTTMLLTMTKPFTPMSEQSITSSSLTASHSPTSNLS
jgi:hypothetical protein